jgi:hypothetical protein
MFYNLEWREYYTILFYLFLDQLIFVFGLFRRNDLGILVLGFRDRLAVLHEVDYHESILLNKILKINRFWCNKTTYLFTLVAREGFLLNLAKQFFR